MDDDLELLGFYVRNLIPVDPPVQEEERRVTKGDREIRGGNEFGVCILRLGGGKDTLDFLT